MSGNSGSEGHGFFEDDELIQIGSRCRELRKEKDMLRESQSQSFGLIRRLELHVKSLSEVHAEDERKIQKLEEELLNCSQEIEYLQDQLNARNAELYNIREHVHGLELKLADRDNLEATVFRLNHELKASDSECLLLIEELQHKDLELARSSSSMQKLEESVSSLTLDSQCEIESMKLDMMCLEMSCVKVKGLREEALLENSRMKKLIKKLEVQLQHSEKLRQALEKENQELTEKLVASGSSSSSLVCKIEEWLEDIQNSLVNSGPLSSELSKKNGRAEEMYVRLTLNNLMELKKGDLGQLFSKLSLVLGPALTLKQQVDSMPNQIRGYEALVTQLKEELREEKMKAKEEAEDLAQEMVELRYQTTCMLEEESKRRASIEQASLLRIAELEAQIQKQQKNFSATVRGIPQV